MGDGKPPTGRHRSWTDVSRLFRWTGDGYFADADLHPDVRRAYLFCAGEVDAFVRTLERSRPPTAAAPTVAPAATPSSSGWVGFPDALRAAMAGAHIARSTWRGEEYVTAQAGYPDGIGVNANTAKATGMREGERAAFGPYLLRRMPQVPDELPDFEYWTPSQNDLFATDWRVLERH